MEFTQQMRAAAKQIRCDILQMVHNAGSGHPGGSLSGADIMAALYFSDQFQCDPSNSGWNARDRFILSKGHCAPLLYSTLIRRGFGDVSLLPTLRKLGSPLQGHPKMSMLAGIDCSSGSLGQGLSVSNGIAFATARQNLPTRVYCLLGDGELQEGQVWEAAMFAAQHKLDNVCAIVDYNNVQLDGKVSDIKDVYPLREKWEAFNWNTIEVDGHDVDALYNAFVQARNTKGKPTVLLANCVKGKGVSFMEHQAKWHGTAPSNQELAQALAEVEAGQ